jgi:tRNA (guanine37-N1)-methyltransferase
MGDFVLTGGEIAAMAVVDATARMIPGVLACEESFADESHFSGLLEYPQYTRPAEWHGKVVPEVLMNGNHKLINEWKRKAAIENTYRKRRGMLSKAALDKKDMEILQKLKEE